VFFFRNLSLLSRRRLWWVAAILLVGYVGVMALLMIAWYGAGLQEQFTWFDDSAEWLQLDKLGHVLVCFQISRAAMGLLRWAEADKPLILWVGGPMGFWMFSPAEVLDGFSPAYGASLPDLISNAVGSAWAIWSWHRWQGFPLPFKHSWLPSPWAPLRPDLLGSNYPQQFVKDYNGMTLWLSLNLRTLLPHALARRVPAWLNIAVGYGGEGMLGGYGKLPEWVIAGREYRQWYIGPDLDLDALAPRYPWARTPLFMVNALRLPMPALRYDRDGLAWTWMGF